MAERLLSLDDRSKIGQIRFGIVSFDIVAQGKPQLVHIGSNDENALTNAVIAKEAIAATTHSPENIN
jgi:hypothetical protein